MKITIDRVGRLGDGVAETRAGPIYVPGAAPGDRVEIDPVATPPDHRDAPTARLKRIHEPGPNRRDPPCPHFGVCGGCTAQHLGPATYAAWKRRLVVDALAAPAGPAAIARADAETLVADLVATPIDTRRRAELAAARTASGTVLGFHRRGSDVIEDIPHCVILRPALARRLAPLRTALDGILHPGWEVVAQLTECANGIDLTLSAVRGFPPGDLDTRTVASLASFAEAHDIARISWRAAPPGSSGQAARRAAPRTVLQRRPPIVQFAGVEVAYPAGAFLQASAAGEAAIAAVVTGAVGQLHPGGGLKIADLYCGLGALTLPLASAGARVNAFDIDGPSLTALESAARRAGHRIEIAARNLARQPLGPNELARFDVVVLDPPRQGAAAQALAFKNSVHPATIVYVSCAPKSFARDAASLADAGYRLRRVVPIDQFVATPHVELVGIFTRP